jgi:hypothetical protein
MTQAIFPKATFSWGTDRVDNQDIVFANDPNSLAAEVGAIETTVGAMPQVEKSPFVGNPVTYGSVDARISDVAAGNLNPYCSISVSNFFVFNNQGPGSRWGHFNTFSKVFDPFGYYNGTDITIQASGLYIITGAQQWNWHDSGYLFHSLYLAGLWSAGHRWDWSAFAGSGPGAFENDRFANTGWTWMGALAAGTRVQVVSENGTSFNSYPVGSSYVKLYCLRKLPQSALG